MMAARFLRRALPALRQARSYAEAASGAPQMSFTFASPTQVLVVDVSQAQGLAQPVWYFQHFFAIKTHCHRLLTCISLVLCRFFFQQLDTFAAIASDVEYVKNAAQVKVSVAMRLASIASLAVIQWLQPVLCHLSLIITTEEPFLLI